MQIIEINNDLWLKTLDITCEKDVWLAHELDKDKDIVGINGYLYSIWETMQRSLKKDLSTSYAIYRQRKPIGYLETTTYDNSSALAYALLKSERGNGYATITVKKITDLLLTSKTDDINRVFLVIHPNNIRSQLVAKRAGFIDDGLSYEEHMKQEYITYQKTKTMLHMEKNYR